MGAPTKLTPEAMRHMEQAVVLGANKRVAAATMGVVYETLRAWLQRGQEEALRLEEAERSGRVVEPLEDEALYLECFRRFEKARAQGALNLLGKLQVASATDWRAALVLLEKMFPADYGKKKAVEVSTDEQTVRNIVKVIKGVDFNRL